MMRLKIFAGVLRMKRSCRLCCGLKRRCLYFEDDLGGYLDVH